MRALMSLIEILATDEIEKYGGKWPAAVVQGIAILFGVFFVIFGVPGFLGPWETARLAKIVVGLAGSVFGVFLIGVGGAVICEITRMNRKSRRT